MADELLSLVRDHPFVLDREAIRVTASAGLAQIEERSDAGELLSRADIATYAAKEAGRDRVAEFSDEGRMRMEEKRVWSERVRAAIEQGLFVLMSQPIVDLATGVASQHEILLRMRGDNGELVAPGAFLDTAERFGLIGGIDRWVVRQAVRLIDSHSRAGHPLTLEVNLSAKTMGDPEFPALVARELRSTGADPANLIFEVTETAAVSDLNQARRFAESLTRLGCRFALDDFGAGFASFYYLKHLPISFLKIDGEFIRELTRTPTDQLVVQALVHVSRVSPSRRSPSSWATRKRSSWCASTASTWSRATTPGAPPRSPSSALSPPTEPERGARTAGSGQPARNGKGAAVIVPARKSGLMGQAVAETRPRESGKLRSGHSFRATDWCAERG